jgi:hypothetical protein
MQRASTELKRASEFLTRLLQRGRVRSQEVFHEAAREGIRTATLRRAARALNVRMRPVGEIGARGARHWTWTLPSARASDTPLAPELRARLRAIRRR